MPELIQTMHSESDTSSSGKGLGGATRPPEKTIWLHMTGPIDAKPSICRLLLKSFPVNK